MREIGGLRFQLLGSMRRGTGAGAPQEVEVLCGGALLEAAADAGLRVVEGFDDRKESMYGSSPHSGIGPFLRGGVARGVDLE